MDKDSLEQISFNFQTTQKDHEIREAIFEIQKALGIEEEAIIDNFKSLHSLMKKAARPSQGHPQASRDDLENFLS